MRRGRSDLQRRAQDLIELQRAPLEASRVPAASGIVWKRGDYSGKVADLVPNLRDYPKREQRSLLPSTRRTRLHDLDHVIGRRERRERELRDLPPRPIRIVANGRGNGDGQRLSCSIEQPR